jgi:hypothetical protein
MFSSDPFQRLTAGGTYNRTFTIFAHRYDLFLTISGMIFVPMAALMITLQLHTGSSMHTLLTNGSPDSVYYSGGEVNDDMMDDATATATAAEADANDDAAKAMNKFMTQFFVEYVVFMFFAIGAQAAMALAVAEMYANREPNVVQCLKKGFSRWCDIFGAAMLIGLGVGLSNVVVQIIGVLLIYTGNNFFVSLAFLIIIAYCAVVMYVMVTLMILSPVIMVEGTGPIKSIKRCWELSSNNRCYMFCTVFCMAMVYYAIQLVISLILFMGGGTEAVYSWWGALLLVLPALVYVPLVVIADTVVYFNIRVQREGMNYSVLDSELYGESSTLDQPQYAFVDSKQELV